MRLGCDGNVRLRPGQVDAFLDLDRFLQGYIQGHGRISYMSQNEVMQFNWEHDLMDCAHLYYNDGDHFSAVGEERFGARLPRNFIDPKDAP